MDGVTYQQWLMLIKISLLEDKNEMMIVELKEKIKVSETNPYFYQVLNLLIDKSIIIHTKTIKNHRFIKVNYKKLDNYIRETKIFKTFGNWVSKKVSGYRY